MVPVMCNLHQDANMFWFYMRMPSFMLIHTAATEFCQMFMLYKVDILRCFGGVQT
jgi:hypothetical protein